MIMLNLINILSTIFLIGCIILCFALSIISIIIIILISIIIIILLILVAKEEIEWQIELKK